VKINVLLVCPSGLTTETAAVPTAFAGMTAVIEVLLVGFTIVAWLQTGGVGCCLQTSTVAPDWKFLPVIVICDPPETPPEPVAGCRQTGVPDVLFPPTGQRIAQK
jgi:hypothetical protein